MTVTSTPKTAAMVAALPPQAISAEVLLEKYAKGDEQSVGDVHRRVARALAEAEPPEQRAPWAERFAQALEQGFIPAGRIQSAAGTGLAATLINCFVQPVGDSITADRRRPPRHLHRAGRSGRDHAPRRRRRLRLLAHPPARAPGSAARSSSATGPVSYMRVFDRSCETVESAGARRGAQMGVLRCDHPDIEEFIHAKDRGDLTNFNISVGVTDAFMQAVRRRRRGRTGAPRRARRGAEGRRRLPARRRHVGLPQGAARASCGSRSCASTYDHAEPGVLFLDRINRDNNLSYCETIEATNPCGEQPLPAYGCCCLGSIDLTRFVQRSVRGRRRVSTTPASRNVVRTSPCACSTTCST